MIYFDNSSTTFFKPDAVINAVSNTLKYLSANPGRASHKLAAKVAMMVHGTRKKVASLVNCDAERVIFTYNCTDALNAAIFGTLQVGGHIITTAYEHNSVLRPLSELKRQNKIRLTILPPNEAGIVTAEMIEREIRQDTYLLAINHVSNVTGATSPITEIGRLAKRAGLLLLVDGAQSVGYTILDMVEQNIDMLAIAPHKGLHAPQGIGCLALSNSIRIRPVRFGGTGTSSVSLIQPDELPEAMEAGTVATPAIAGLNSAVDYNRKHFFAAQSKVTSLSMYMRDGLSSIPGIKIYTPGNTFNGIFSFNLGHLNSADVGNILSEAYGICVRSGLHCAPLVHKHHGTVECGMVRASLSAENSMDEIDIFVNALKEINRNYN